MRLLQWVQPPTCPGAAHWLGVGHLYLAWTVPSCTSLPIPALDQLPDTDACLCLQDEDLDALLGPLPSLALHSDDEVALCHITEPEQVSHHACASAHRSASGASCVICLLYLLA